MNKEEVEHLANLSRIELTGNESAAFAADISLVLEYVSQVKDIIAAEGSINKKLGPVYNVLREDKITNEPEQYTEAILNEMPKTNGRYLEVRKILNTDN